jgi:hypothetical protein
MDIHVEQQIKTLHINEVYEKMTRPYYLRDKIYPLVKKLKAHEAPLSSPYYLNRFVYLAVTMSDRYYGYPTHGLHAQHLGEEVGMLLYFHFLDEIKGAKCQSSMS